MSNYADYQSQRDREYAEAWAKLPARKRKQLAEAGITGPELPLYHTSKPDEEEFVERCPDTVAFEPEAMEEPEDEIIAVLRRIVGELIAQDNIRLSLECFSLATGINYTGKSMVQIAREHGVTRAAVSRRCVDFVDVLGLPPSRAMRRLTARGVYEQRQQHILNRRERFSGS